MVGRKPYETTELTSYGASRRLRPPDCLGELQKQAFIDLVSSCSTSQFRKCDVALLCRWAELTVIAEQAAFEMQPGDGQGSVPASAEAVSNRVAPGFGQGPLGEGAAAG